MAEWADRKGDDGIGQYWGSANSVSLDGLPALGGIAPQ